MHISQFWIWLEFNIGHNIAFLGLADGLELGMMQKIKYFINLLKHCLVSSDGPHSNLKKSL